jgi:ribosomal protein S27E
VGLWRCTRISCSEDAHGRNIYDFDRPEPVCPKCGSDMRKPRGGILKLEVIHYDPPGDLVIDQFRRGRNEAACSPGRPFKGFASGAPDAVTCPACKRTAVWREAAVEAGVILPAPPDEEPVPGPGVAVPEEADIRVVVDPKGMMFKEETAGEKEE